MSRKLGTFVLEGKTVQGELSIEERLETAAVVESAQLPDGKRKLVFEAIVAEANFLNRNRRIYPLDVLWPAFEQVNEDLGAYPGEVDHPTDGKLSYSSNGIAWRAFWLEGTSVKARGEIIWTQRGSDLAANIEAGIKVGFSTRSYTLHEEVEMEGQLARRIRRMTPPFVDAVVDPSVRHARMDSYTKEELDTMEQELTEAREKMTAAESRATQAEEQLTTANGRIAELEQRNTELEAQAAEAITLKAEGAYTAKLNELTGEHRFGAAIRAEVEALRSEGVQITAENVEKYVARFTPLVEAAGAAANNEATPRGDVSTDEDKDPPVHVVSQELTDKQRADLAAGGLL